MKLLILVAFFATFALVAHGAAVEEAPKEEKVEEMVTSVMDYNEDCHQPRETGRCFALFYRYAFNVETRACEEFIYGGCAGNKNNFESKEECERKCMSQETSTDADATEQPKEDSTTAES